MRCPTRVEQARDQYRCAAGNTELLFLPNNKQKNRCISFQCFNEQAKLLQASVSWFPLDTGPTEQEVGAQHKWTSTTAKSKHRKCLAVSCTCPNAPNEVPNNFWCFNAFSLTLLKFPLNWEPFQAGMHSFHIQLYFSKCWEDNWQRKQTNWTAVIDECHTWHTGICVSTSFQRLIPLKEIAERHWTFQEEHFALIDAKRFHCRFWSKHSSSRCDSVTYFALLSLQNQPDPGITSQFPAWNVSGSSQFHAIQCTRSRHHIKKPVYAQPILTTTKSTSRQQMESAQINMSPSGLSSESFLSFFAQRTCDTFFGFPKDEIMWWNLEIKQQALCILLWTTIDSCTWIVEDTGVYFLFRNLTGGLHGHFIISSYFNRKDIHQFHGGVRTVVVQDTKAGTREYANACRQFCWLKIFYDRWSDLVAWQGNLTFVALCQNDMKGKRVHLKAKHHFVQKCYTVDDQRTESESSQLYREYQANASTRKFQKNTQFPHFLCCFRNAGLPEWDTRLSLMRTTHHFISHACIFTKHSVR